MLDLNQMYTVIEEEYGGDIACMCIAILSINSSQDIFDEDMFNSWFYVSKLKIKIHNLFWDYPVKMVAHAFNISFAYAEYELCREMQGVGSSRLEKFTYYVCQHIDKI